MMVNLLNAFKQDTQKIIFATVIVLAFLYLDFSYIIKLQYKLCRDTNAKIVALKNDLVALNKKLTEVNRIKEGQLKQKELLPQKKIISEEELSLLLNDISNIANKDKIKIIQMMPTRDILKEKLAKFSPLGISLDLICNYHDLGGFINDLENEQKFIALDGLRILRRKDNTLGEEVNLVLKTYVYK